MEEKIKMSMKNEEGKTITKEIPKSLYSLYKGIGWKETGFGSSKISSKNGFVSNKSEEKSDKD